ncbi:MAG: selenocysteine-specific translation elongation factor, partial [Candidatus Eremiobacteraeota bacterium]|nr:selenocysteine-specific translation elongation factor [Candidatus Eremiobacteraeota bacterium]
MHIVGTAGHVDHGKSSLVAALTGTNPDRWIEEQLRGMTLDLGFAHLRYDDGVEAGIVDVPGHERFLHNMLAGAAGMELLLLVVAANEGVMPQTREHLAILQYLNVRRTILVMTKIDLVRAAERAAATAAIESELAGTLAAGAPAVEVSTVTGEGLAELRARIAEALRALEPRDVDAPAYLPIDRVFALPGLGTIVTGTLMQGAIAAGDRLQIAPQGRAVRARSVHVFGTPRERATAGARVAVNLPGVEKTDLKRGDVLADPQFAAASSFRVRFRAWPDAVPLLRRRNPVRVHIGSAEILGTLTFEEAPKDASTCDATLYLRAPVSVYPRAGFVVRRMSPKTLLGGGVVEAHAATSAPDAAIAHEDAVLAVVREAGLKPMTAAEVGAAANLREEIVERVLVHLADEDRVIALARPVAFAGREAAAELLERCTAHLEEAQRRTPWMLGQTSLALARVFSMDEGLLTRFLAAFSESGAIAAHRGYYATTDHVPKLTDEQRAFFEAAVPFDRSTPFVPADLEAVVESMRRSRIAGLSQAFDTLVAR